jgi:hypothetical protein
MHCEVSVPTDPPNQHPPCHPASTYAATSRSQTTTTILPQDPGLAPKPYQKTDESLAVLLTTTLHENPTEKDQEQTDLEQTDRYITLVIALKLLR